MGCPDRHTPGPGTPAHLPMTGRARQHGRSRPAPRRPGRAASAHSTGPPGRRRSRVRPRSHTRTHRAPPPIAADRSGPTRGPCRTRRRSERRTIRARYRPSARPSGPASARPSGPASSRPSPGAARPLRHIRQQDNHHRAHEPGPSRGKPGHCSSSCHGRRPNRRHVAGAAPDASVAS